MDTARDTFNVVDNFYHLVAMPRKSSAVGLDILSNGFKIRESGSEFNDWGSTKLFTPHWLKIRSKPMAGLLVKLTPSF